MKTIVAGLALSLFASVACVQAADDKAPVAKPATASDKPKASSPAVTAAASDCCCTDTVCKLPVVRKVAMSPKAAALLANK